MARVPDKIKDIYGSKETLKLAVRITDLWFVETWDKFDQAEMVIIDCNGDQIQAICKKDQLKSWKSILKENCTYIMHNFKVIRNDGQYRVCAHQYKLIFTRVTVVRETNLPDLPVKTHNFIKFSNVINGNFERGLLVDVIGIVHELTYQQPSPENRRVVFKLKDLSDQLLMCTLWEDYCQQFLEYLNDHNNEQEIVILLTHARIKDSQGPYPATISNSLKASKLFINQPVPDIQEFKQKLTELKLTTQPVLKFHTQPNSQHSSTSQFSEKDTFFYKVEVKSLSEINQISKQTVCVTVGTIGRIIMGNHSWCSTACIKCNKKTNIDTMSFTCTCGKYNEHPILRYRLEIMVYHKNQSTKFLLWDRECTELIGHTADEVNRLKIADGDVDLNASPQALDKILGYTLAFKVKVQPNFKNSVVLTYSFDLDLINTIIDLLPNPEVVGPHGSNDPTEYDNQSLSATADHDPLLQVPFTSTKWQSHHEYGAETPNLEISPTQLSSNRIAKHIKIE